MAGRESLIRPSGSPVGTVPESGRTWQDHIDINL